MLTQEIPREQWHGFFDAFSRQHEGWLASLEVFEKTLGAQPEAELPLEGISLDTHDAGSEAIVITLGEHRTHTSRTLSTSPRIFGYSEHRRVPMLRSRFRQKTIPAPCCASVHPHSPSLSMASFDESSASPLVTVALIASVRALGDAGSSAPKARNMTARGKREAKRSASPLVNVKKNALQP